LSHHGRSTNDELVAYSKGTIWRLAVPATLSLAVAVSAPICTILLAEYGVGAEPVLVCWCVVLIGLAVWLNQVSFHRGRTLLPFLVGVAIVLLIWLWQRQAFNTLVPKSGLTWGYFLSPEGAKARFWVLICPFWAGVACLSLTCACAIFIGWRAGHRLSLLCLLAWWLAVFVVFALPSVFLDGQGNASIFI
jgi:hypothetical protein